MEHVLNLLDILRKLLLVKTKQRIDVITLEIPAGGEWPFTKEMDKRYAKLTGIAVQKQSNAKLNFKSFDVNGNSEDFAPGFELAFISTDQNISPDFRFWTLDHPANGYKIDGVIVDDGSAPSYPYFVNIHIRLER